MTRMECTQIDDLLMDYLYQELAPEQAEAFRAHLDSCERCAHEVQSFQGVREAVRDLPVLEPPRALTAQLLHQAAEAKKPAFPWLKSLWELLQPKRNFYAVAAAASLVIVLFVGYALRQGKIRSDFTADERAVATAESPAPAPMKALRAETPTPAAAPMGATAGDDLKSTPAEKPAGGEARPIDTLTEKDGKLAAAKGGGGIPVTLDNDSIQRKQAPDNGLGWDTSNAARAADGRKGLGLGAQGRLEPPRDQTVQRETKQAIDGQRPRFADFPKQQAPAAREQAATRGAQAAPIINAPAGGPAGGGQRAPVAMPQAPQPAPAAAAPAPTQLQKRAQQGPAPRTIAAEAPAANKEEAESRYYRRGGSTGQALPPPAPARQRVAEGTVGNRDENANDKAAEHGFAQAPAPDERTRMRANVDFKNAMGTDCDKQIKLLEEFIRKYPWDNRIEQAKIRIAVCRARLTGQSEEIDDELRKMERNRQKRSLHEAEQRAAPDRYAPARKAPSPMPALERQTSYKARKAAPKPAARPTKAEPVQQAVKAPGKGATRADDAKPVAKAKAPAEKPAVAAKDAKAPAEKPAVAAKGAKAPAKAGSAASASKTKKAAPAKADEGRSKPAAATTSK
jgi:hypothetical protein